MAVALIRRNSFPTVEIAAIEPVKRGDGSIRIPNIGDREMPIGFILARLGSDDV